MTVKELIKELVKYDMNQKIEMCLYTSINDPEEMVIYDDLIDKNGNTPCQVRKEITLVSIEIDGKTVCIS